MSFFLCSCPSEAPSSLGDLVKRVIKKMGRKGRLTEEEVAEAWASAVGAGAAVHTRPVSFRRAALTVNVDGSSWLYDLTLKKKEILQKLEEGLKSKKIKSIRFRIGEVDGKKEDDRKRNPSKG